MRIYFFLGSARGEDEPAVARFHSDLEVELRELAGSGVGGQRNHPAGATGPLGAVADAAGLAPVTVALCSDRYFADEQCSRDWSRFTGRARADDGETFVPLLWRPAESCFSDDVTAHLERAGRGLGPAYNSSGLYHLLRERARDDYYEVVRQVAARVYEAARRQGGTRTVPAPTPDRLAHRPPARRAAGRRLVVSYVGSDQEWADWIMFAALAAGQVVEQVPWNPTREALADSAARIRANNPDVVVVLLSRRFRPVDLIGPVDLVGPPALQAVDWEMFGDGSVLGAHTVRVVIDNEPLPEPLRAGASFDVSELDDQAVGELFAELGIDGTDDGPAAPPAPRRPGTPPPTWNTPAENEFFAGRDDELQRLHTLLSTEGRAVVAGNGLSYLGVTEVAIEYSHRNKLRYGAVWWISPGDDEPARTAELRRRLQVAAAGGAGGAAGAGAGAADPLPSLIVFADADKPSEYASYLAEPASLGIPAAKVLVVARQAESAWSGSTVEIGPLRREESVLFLREAAPMVAPDLADRIAAGLDDRPGLLAGAGRLLLRGEVSPQACADLVAAARAAVPRPGQAAAGDASRPLLPEPAADEPAAGAGIAAGLGGHPRRTRARGAGGRPVGGGSSAVTDRDVTSLVGELRQVDCVNDPERFATWHATLETLLGRPVRLLPAAPLVAKLAAVVEDAVDQPGPAMLDAVARALELTDPADRQVLMFRRLVDHIARRWDTPSAGPSAGAWADSDVTHTARGAVANQVPGALAQCRYLFFTSYARQRDNALVRRFHQALQEELNVRVPRDETAEGFLDLLSLQGGVHWRFELRGALIGAPVLLGLWSDDYFGSDWCGREFAVFAERVRRAAVAQGSPPPAIIPLQWLRLTRPIPEAATHLQFPAIHLGGDRPLVDLMRHSPRAFRKHLSALAERIQEVSRETLPPLDSETADELRPAFGASS